MIGFNKSIIALFIPLVFTGCDFFNTTNKQYYKLYSEIDSSDGVNSWLPERFPKDSVDIEVESNIESNYLLVFFSLNKNKFIDEEGLIPLKHKDLMYLKKINTNIDKGWCFFSERNMWKEKRPTWYVLGKLDNGKRYLLSYANNAKENLCGQ